WSVVLADLKQMALQKEDPALIAQFLRDKRAELMLANENGSAIRHGGRPVPDSAAAGYPPGVPLLYTKEEHEAKYSNRRTSDGAAQGTRQGYPYYIRRKSTKRSIVGVGLAPTLLLAGTLPRGIRFLKIGATCSTFPGGTTSALPYALNWNCRIS